MLAYLDMTPPTQGKDYAETDIVRCTDSIMTLLVKLFTTYHVGEYFAKCMHSTHKNSEPKCTLSEVPHPYTQVLAALQESPWYKKNGGIDHLWTIPDYRLPMSLDGYRVLSTNTTATAFGSKRLTWRLVAKE